MIVYISNVGIYDYLGCFKYFWGLNGEKYKDTDFGLKCITECCGVFQVINKHLFSLAVIKHSIMFNEITSFKGVCTLSSHQTLENYLLQKKVLV